MNLEELYDKWRDYKSITDPIEALKAVKENGWALQHVHNQTEAICLEAVKQDGHTLKYVINQTEAICLEAVKQNGMLLIYVHPHIFERLFKMDEVLRLTSPSRHLRENK